MKTVWLWCILVLALVGCGGMGGAKSASPARSGGGSPNVVSAGTSAGAPAGGSMDRDSTMSTQSESGPSADFRSAPEPQASLSPPPASPTRESSSVFRDSPRTPAPQERPGLGTEWGEQRVSHVHDVAFVRADEDRPFAVANLHYNDRTGVEALAAFHQNAGPRLRETSAAGGAITVSIHDGSGEPLEAVHVGDRTYVMGESGQRYTIVLTNHTGHRFEAIATVDGLDVINGKTGSMDNRGYVLMPFATLDIDGFRQGRDTVAAFRFAKVSDSYAAQMGSARNVGVIGVAFFAEKNDVPAPYTQDELHTRDTASPFPGGDPRFARPPVR